MAYTTELLRALDDFAKYAIYRQQCESTNEKSREKAEKLFQAALGLVKSIAARHVSLAEQRGREAERLSVIKFLRKIADDDRTDGPSAYAFDGAADMLERFEHHKEKSDAEV